jgi:phage gp46-like protein
VAGSYSGTVYGDGEELEAPDTEESTDIYFEPYEEGLHEGTMTATGATTTTDGAMSGTGFLPDILEFDAGLDVALDFTNGVADLIVNEENFDFESVDNFDTLIETLLFTDGRSDKYQTEDAKQRRGWTGDFDQTTYKSLVWLKDQSKQTQDDLNELVDYAKDVLQYIVKNKIADEVTVSAEVINRETSLEIQIKIGNNVVKKYVPIWRSYELPVTN